MGNFSRDTFSINKNKHYVNVRLQQGVPLVDADWNEMDDIRKHELQDFLRTFIGSGVPGDKDFLIIPRGDGSDNDFVIYEGCCLVSGQLVINKEGISYSDQRLPDQQPLPPLKTPEKIRIDTVYLDVWEREVDSTKDPDLVNSDIGVETCVRIKREWIVRVAEGVEGSGEAASFPNELGHDYYILANLTRDNSPTIKKANIIDQRFTGMNLRDSIVQSVDLSRIHKVPLLQQTLFTNDSLVSVTVGTEPRGIAFDGSHIWVANYASGNVSKIDIISNTKELDIVVGSNPIDVAFDGRYIWVTNSGGYVSIIDTTRTDNSAKVADIAIALGSSLNGIAFDGKYIWVTNSSGYVSKIDTTRTDDSAKVADIAVGSNPDGIAFDGTYIWVVNNGSRDISKIDIKSNSVVATLNSYLRYGGIRVAFDGTHIWVTGTDNVVKFDIKSNERVASVPLQYAHGIAFDGTHILVTTNVCLMTKIDISRNIKVADIALSRSGPILVIGSVPNYIAFDGTHIWMTLNKENKLIKMKKII